MSRLNSVWALAALAAAAMLAIPASAPAKPLEYDYCQELKTEQRTLRNAGVERDMRRGPNWAKANLTDADLGRIRRYLTVEEQIHFRCGIKRKPKKARPKTAAKPPQAIPVPDRYRFRQPSEAEADLINAPAMTALPRAEPAKQVMPVDKPTEKPQPAAAVAAEPARLLTPSAKTPPPPAQGAALAGTPAAEPVKQPAPSAKPAPKPDQSAALAATAPKVAPPPPTRKSDMLPSPPTQPAAAPQKPPVTVSIREIDTKEIANGMGVEMKAEKKSKKPRRRTIRRRQPRRANEDKDWLSFD